jgi:hypothetical protein
MPLTSRYINLHAVSTRVLFDKTCLFFTFVVIILTMVSIVLALSVLVLIVVSDAVLEPMTTTFGTVRQLRLPPADLKLNRRIADDKRSPSRPPPSAPCCPRDGCDCDVSPVSHALLPKLPHLVADSRLLEHPCNSDNSDCGFARAPFSSPRIARKSIGAIRRNFGNSLRQRGNSLRFLSAYYISPPDSIFSIFCFDY